MVKSVLVEDRAVPKHSSTRLTYDDYLQFPDDGLRHEIIEGEHYVTPSPSTRHQRILLKLSYLLQSYLETNPVGEIFSRRSTCCYPSSMCSSPIWSTFRRSAPIS